MKTPSNDLNEIIASLTTQEINTYLLYVGNKETMYLELFRLLVKSNDASDTQLKQELRRKGYRVSNFSRIKNYLYDSIIDFLSTLENKSSMRYLIRRQIAALETLIDKRLLKQAHKLLSKLKPIALQLNLEAQMIDLLNLESEMLVQDNYCPDYTSRSQHLIREFRSSIERLDCTCEITEYHLETKEHLAISYKGDINMNRLGYVKRRLIHMTELPTEGSNSYLHHVIMADYLLGIIAYIEEDEASYSKNYLHALDLIKNDQKYIDTYTKRYLVLVANLGDVSILVRDYAQINFVIDTIKKFEPKTHIANEYIKEIIFTIVIRKLSLSADSIEEMEFVAENYTRYVLEKKSWISNIVAAYSIIDLIIINLLTGYTSNTLKLIENYETNPEINKDNGHLLLFIELLTCIDKNSDELVESRARSLVRRMEADNPLRKVVQHLSRFSWKLDSTNHYKQTREMFINCPSELLNPDPQYKELIMQWFNAKTNSQSCAQNYISQNKDTPQFSITEDPFFRLIN